MWWDIRKLGEPVEILPLEFAGYRPGQKLGGIALEYESSMVRIISIFAVILISYCFSPPNSWLEQNKELFSSATAREKLKLIRLQQLLLVIMGQSIHYKLV